MQHCPIYTTQEACARAIQWMARGHVAHEHVFLNTAIVRIRALPLAETPDQAYQNALDEVAAMRQETSGHYVTLLNWSIERIIQEVGTRRRAPMAIYSDHRKWWPKQRIAA
jgi:hypothetical protein